ncbi:hypothetical protein AMATHDRAFT_195293 [Amanita thiersii Skay4041]|uniref:CNNM transmembrane domain-containing protein n=1 Tax=Amanita thiersii Skay4041 TaxID=703135 RepID=A0A2A9NDQ0_9AGAR|nr:hypothetical protein AMATHDRAFT_195293 [Amanita thiersii Skay4041]
MISVVPVSRRLQSSRLLYALINLVSFYVPHLFRRDSLGGLYPQHLAKRAREEFNPHDPHDIAFAILIPVLVLLSGLFAGLTLGYMSLDETQLNVLSVSGTPTQRKYANKIKPIRKNGHLLLVTLLLANMIVNETLPIIADPILGGGFPSVVVSTVLIVIFAEIIPQSLFTRHGLYLGAKMAGLTQILIYALVSLLKNIFLIASHASQGIVSWPVAKFLEFVLGAHHGIIYRRAELKELIAMHSAHAAHGGDLKTNTVTIIGATLDLQEKVVKQAMTPIENVFMLSIDSKLDYDLLKKICETGHSRVPVYEEIDVPVYDTVNTTSGGNERTRRVKRILGILLVKHCVLLDPKDVTPLRKIQLNKVPFVPNNEPLLGILDKFQEGRSHMAIVSRFSEQKAASVKQAVKRGLTQRLLERVGIGDSDDSSSSGSSGEDSSVNASEGSAMRQKYSFRRRLKRARRKNNGNDEGSLEDGEATLRGGRESMWDNARTLENGGEKTMSRENTMALGIVDSQYLTPLVPATVSRVEGDKGNNGRKIHGLSIPLKAVTSSTHQLEQSMPADAVLSKEGADEFLKNFDPAVMPLGIITLEDVLEELIGEEIYDEFDLQGARGDPCQVPPIHVHPEPPQRSYPPRSGGPPAEETRVHSSPTSALGNYESSGTPFSGLHVSKPLKALEFLSMRSRSAPPVPRDNNSKMQDGDQISEPEALPPVQRSGASLGTILAVPEPTLTLGGRLRSRAGSTKRATVTEGKTPADTSMSNGSYIIGSSPENTAGATMSVAENSRQKSLAPAGSPGSAVTSGLLAPQAIKAHHSISFTANSPVFGVSASSRAASPPTPLEAILLDRKRRMHSSGATSGYGAYVGGTSSTQGSYFLPSTEKSPAVGMTSLIPGIVNEAGGTSDTSLVVGHPVAGKIRGTRFKSSPLDTLELKSSSCQADLLSPSAHGREQSEQDVKEIVGDEERKEENLKRTEGDGC